MSRTPCIGRALPNGMSRYKHSEAAKSNAQAQGMTVGNKPESRVQPEPARAPNQHRTKSQLNLQGWRGCSRIALSTRETDYYLTNAS
eukprot:5400790-Heterocapsa_arctica.AAC.1